MRWICVSILSACLSASCPASGFMVLSDFQAAWGQLAGVTGPLWENVTFIDSTNIESAATEMMRPARDAAVCFHTAALTFMITDESGLQDFANFPAGGDPYHISFESILQTWQMLLHGNPDVIFERTVDSEATSLPFTGDTTDSETRVRSVLRTASTRVYGECLTRCDDILMLLK